MCVSVTYWKWIDSETPENSVFIFRKSTIEAAEDHVIHIEVTVLRDIPIIYYKRMKNR